MTRSPLLARLIGAAAIGLAALPATALPATAQTALRDEPYINEQLVAVAAGDAIRKTCPDISARMVTVFMKGRALKSYANDKGYADAEIEAFLDDPAEKARVRGLAAEYLAGKGAAPGDVAGHCKVGRAEIAAGSLIGSLLKAN